MIQKRSVHEQGFTVIELTIALAFLSFMLIFVVSATVQIMRSYNKGLTTKQMNQTGRSITEDMARTARMAWAESVYDESDQGRLCMGGVTYAWNEPAVPGQPTINSNVFTDGSPIDIVRIEDQNQEYCKDTTLDIPVPSSDVAVSSLTSGAVRILGMEVAQSDDRRLLSVAFNVSSVGVDTPVLVGTDYQCPTDGNALFGTFCAIAPFETTVYLRNKDGE